MFRVIFFRCAPPLLATDLANSASEKTHRVTVPYGETVSASMFSIPIVSFVAAEVRLPVTILIGFPLEKPSISEGVPGAPCQRTITKINVKPSHSQENQKNIYIYIYIYIYTVHPNSWVTQDRFLEPPRGSKIISRIFQILG